MPWPQSVTDPVLEGFPSGTVLSDFVRLGFRDDDYRCILVTGDVITHVSVSDHELKRAPLFADLLTEKLKLLRWRHHFNLIYQRGPYA